MTARSIIRQAEITRAVKALRAAGERHYRIAIAPDGTMILTGGQDEAPPPVANSFDRLLRK